MSDLAGRFAQALAGRYRLERELGQGGMATVYLAEDLRHQRRVAIKVLKPELAAVLGADRFLREIRIAANLQSPHVLPLLDSGDANGLLYFVMPYVKGESLRDRLARDGALSPGEAVRLLREIADGLAHAHRHGVVHRDIKPDNVMLSEGHALLMDFGVAKALSQDRGGSPAASTTLTDVGISIGTPAYMAPEQGAADPTIDHRADIYAIGVTAYEMLAGAPPFRGTPQAVIAAHLATPPPPLESGIPPAVAVIVMRCLAKRREDRYQTADQLLEALGALVTPGGTALGPAAAPATRRRRASLTLLGLAVLGGIGMVAIRQFQRHTWVRETAIPEMRRMIEDGQADSAWYLGLEAREIASHDATIAKLFQQLSRNRTPSIITRPPGARVYRASLADTSRWQLVGTTPLDSVTLPYQIGLFRFDKQGYRTLHTLGLNFFFYPFPLDRTDAPDSDMITVAGADDYDIFLVGTDGSPELALADWKIARYETTNREYKAFVDAGGYRDSTWWEFPIQDGGQRLSWRQAVTRFVDQTGRPGPSTWVAGDYPTGQAEMPVGGVSWYEAAAYAKWAGKSLPTIYHWARAAGIWLSRAMVPLSNMQGTGPWKVGAPRAVSAVGASDMAGNVREWNFNEVAASGERYILGGGWSDPSYGFVDAYAQPPMDRSAINGIRLAKYDPTDTNVARARSPIVRAFTDYTKVRSAPDAVFEGYRHQFDYDPLPLDARVERTDSTSDEWLAQFVSFTAAYGGERMQAWVFLPKGGTPPYQPVVYFPGSGAINTRTSAERRDMGASFVVKSGRAFVLPIYQSTYERTDSLTSDIPDQSIFWRDHVVMWGKDYRRTLDYLSSRPDMDSTRFAYFGFSWGGLMGGLIPAIEPRIKAAVLYVAGLTMERSRPEVDPINYLPHIRIPVLMLNGKYDFFFPTETSQRPFFERLGTPSANKKYVVYEGGHDVPRPTLIGETLSWLDHYLGPVTGLGVAR